MNIINGEARITNTHIYFWNGVYSQWSKSIFTEDGVTYPNAEQYMMQKKAEVFGATDILDQMKKTSDPRVVKGLGRKIKNFDDAIWDKHKMKIVTQAQILKFTQNPLLLEQLLEDRDRVIVEASPVDRVWGIGLHYDNDEVLNESNWNGQNLLGKCIMEAREQIINEGNY